MPLAEHPNCVNDMDIPRKSGIMTEKELDISEKYTVQELLLKLRSGELSSSEVTLAFSKRAAMAQQLVSRVCSFTVNQPLIVFLVAVMSYRNVFL